MENPYIFNIQRFSMHDGPGLRSTIFFKGCPLRCPWCHNPEAISFEPEMIVNKDGKSALVGRQYTIPELVKEVAKDQIFYDQSDGGVTLSGGEVMVQNFDYITELVQVLKHQGFSVGIDTCGVAATERFRQIATWADFFLYDLKFIDAEVHRHYTQASNELVLKNLRTLSDLGAKIYLRMLLLAGINTSPAAITRTVAWLQENDIRPFQINLLPYHKLGRDKRIRLGMPAPEFETPTDTQLSVVRKQLEMAYPNVTIGG